MTGTAPDLRRDVEALAAMVRESAGPGERASAEWLAGRLREAGAADVRVEPFRFQPSWASALVPHYLAGIAGSMLGGPAGGVLATAALASFEAEFSGREQWIRRRLPASEGANVLARIPARQQRKRTLVLIAHHDAAQTGYLWALPLTKADEERAARTDRRLPASAASEAALALVATGCAIGRAPGALLRLAGGIVLALASVLALDVSRNETVPGANDNASGVAAVLALAERFRAEPLEGTEVIVVLPGCEESGMGGMGAWMRDHGGALDPASTLVVGLDTIGCGEPIVASAEGPIHSVTYREEDLAWADRGAERAGLAPPRRFRIPGWTDPALARLAGLPAISMLSVKGGNYTNYHLPSDIPANVDFDCAEQCTRLAGGIAEAFDAAP